MSRATNVRIRWTSHSLGSCKNISDISWSSRTYKARSRGIDSRRLCCSSFLLLLLCLPLCLVSLFFSLLTPCVPCVDIITTRLRQLWFTGRGWLGAGIMNGCEPITEVLRLLSCKVLFGFSATFFFWLALPQDSDSRCAAGRPPSPWISYLFWVCLAAHTSLRPTIAPLE